MTTCDGVCELLSAALDGELPEDTAAAVTAHLAACACCAEEQRRLAEVRSLVRALPTRRVPDPAGEGLRSAARARERGRRGRQLAAVTALLAAVLAGGALGAAAGQDPTSSVPVDTLVGEHLVVSGPTPGPADPNR